MTSLIRLWRRTLCLLPNFAQIRALFLPAALVFLSLYLHSSGQCPTNYQSFRWDASEYRYLGEHFWGVPHDCASYTKEICFGDWGPFDDRIPFREIGVGTFYLLSRWVYSWLTWNSQVGTADLVWFAPFAVRMFMAFGYGYLYTKVRDIYGGGWAILAFLFLCFPSNHWMLADSMLSEPLSRALAAIFMGQLLTLGHRGSTVARLAGLGLVSVLLTQVRSQWMFILPLLSPLFLVEIVRRREFRLIPVLGAIIIAAPLSLSLVHQIRWGTAAPTVGIGMHINLKTQGEALRRAQSAAPAGTVLGIAQTNKIDDFWRIQISRDNPNLPAEIKLLDKTARQFLLEDWQKRVLKEWGVGMRLSTNFPSEIFVRSPKSAWDTAYRYWDWLIGAVVVAGLFNRRTWLISGVILAYCAIIALGVVFSPYVPRYHSPIANLPLVGAILVAAYWSGRWSTVVRLSRSVRLRWNRAIGSGSRDLPSPARASESQAPLHGAPVGVQGAD